MSTLIGIRDTGSSAVYSPTKEKAGNRAVYSSRLQLLFRRARNLVGAAKVKLLLGFCVLCIVVLFTSRINSFMGWNTHHPSLVSVSSPSRGGYTELINTWKRNSLLKQSVAHYASCTGTDAIHVVWSESDPPSESLKAYLKRIVLSKSQTAQKPNFRFDMNNEDNLNNRFKPIANLRTDAIFSVDDDVIVPCSTLDFAFTVWQTAPSTMVGFIPRMHWLHKEYRRMVVHISNMEDGGQFGGWALTVWFSQKQRSFTECLDLYTNKMYSSIHDYVTKERNCEDVAMSLLVANATGAPPIWVKGIWPHLCQLDKTFEIVTGQ